MKKHLFVALFFLTVVNGFAQQSLEVSAFGGYTGRNNLSITGGSALVEKGGLFGGSITYALQPGFAFEAFYSRQTTILSASSSFDNIRIREEGNVSYWMAGIVTEIPSSVDNIDFYMAFRLGGVTFSTKSGEFDSSIKLATSLGGGLRYHFTDQIGVKVATNFMLPIFDAGASLWFGSGGSGVGASSWCPILQINGTAGLFYTFNY